MFTNVLLMLDNTAHSLKICVCMVKFRNTDTFNGLENCMN